MVTLGGDEEFYSLVFSRRKPVGSALVVCEALLGL
jgi:hypothetical protein